MLQQALQSKQQAQLDLQAVQHALQQAEEELGAAAARLDSAIVDNINARFAAAASASDAGAGSSSSAGAGQARQRWPLPRASARMSRPSWQRARRQLTTVLQPQRLRCARLAPPVEALRKAAAAAVAAAAVAERHLFPLRAAGAAAV